MGAEDEKSKFYSINRKRPTQYSEGIDTFQRAEANMTFDELMACMRFNIDKYTWRKKGEDKADFEKIIDYANFAITQIDTNGQNS